MKLIPKNTGFRGDVEAAMREAKATEFNEVRRLVHVALKNLIHQDNDRWIDLVAMYADEVVVELNGKLWKYGYSIDDANRVVLQAPIEVVREYTPVGITNMTESNAGELLGEHQFVITTSRLPMQEAASATKGLKWRIVVVESGLSLNNNLYPAAVLRESLSLFEGVTVCIKSDAEHLSGNSKAVSNIIGKLESPTFVEANKSDKARIEATLVLLPIGDIPQRLTALYEADMTQNFGFSIDALAQAVKKKQGKLHIVEALKFTQVNSVDLIVEPGAGGRLLEMKEAKGANTMLLSRMVEAVKKHNPALLDGVDEQDETAVLAAHEKMLEALAQPAEKPAAKKVVEAAEHGEGNGVSETRLQEALDIERARTFAVTSLNISKLPQTAVIQLQKQFDADGALTKERVTESINDMQALASTFSKSGHIKMGEFMHSNVDDGKQLLEAFFDPKDNSVTSIREAYLNCTGDTGFTGDFKNCSKTRLAEALDSGSFTDALGEAMHKTLIDKYRKATLYDNWRELVDIVPVNDFRNQERVNIGGYGDLPNVAESGAYGALTSPGDGKEKYAISKKGGTESVTLEMIANDDVGAILRMPGKLNSAAKRTLSKFIFNMFVTNPAMNDGNSWFHADHNNLGSTALSAAAYTAGRLAMMRQVEPGSNAELGILPKFLMVPADLEEAAYDLFSRNTNIDKTFAQSLNPTILPVWCWSDANDWVQACDKSEHPIIELGFFQGREEPELFIQDNPTQGSMFTNDKVTYKIRHIYGGAPMSEMGVRKNVVV